MAAVRVSAVTAEGCDFNSVVVGLALRSIAAHRHQHNAELSSHGKGLWEDTDDFIRRGGCGNVIVGGFAIKKQITDAAPDETGGESALAQRVRDADSFNRFVRRKVQIGLRG